MAQTVDQNNEAPASPPEASTDPLPAARSSGRCQAALRPLAGAAYSNLRFPHASPGPVSIGVETLPPFTMTAQPIAGASLPPKALVMTSDDGPAEQARTLSLARDLNRLGIRATFFLVGCHFTGQPYPAAQSSLCRGWGTESPEMIKELVKLGHRVANHTQDHLDMAQDHSDRLMTPQQYFHHEFAQTQSILDAQQASKPDLLNLVRMPGLSISEKTVAMLRADPEINKLRGQVGVDAAGTSDKLGGDADCRVKGYLPAECADAYVQNIRNNDKAGHGSVVLHHSRTERDKGSSYEQELVQEIVKKLGPEYAYVSIDAIPELNTTPKTPPQLIGPQFNKDFGAGEVVFGRPTGSQDLFACRVVGRNIMCAKYQGAAFDEAVAWTSLPAGLKDVRQLWLESLRGNGLDDLILQGSDGKLWVAASNGAGFDEPRLSTDFLAGVEARDKRAYPVTVADLAGDGRKQLIAWTPEGLLAGSFSGGSFQFSVHRSNVSKEIPLALLSGDLDGSGRDSVAAVTRAGLTRYPASGAAPQLLTEPNHELFRGPWLEQAAQTFSIVNLPCETGLIGRIPTGIVYSKLTTDEAKNPKFDAGRYVLHELTDVKGWKTSGATARYCELSPGKPGICARNDEGLFFVKLPTR